MRISAFLCAVVLAASAAHADQLSPEDLTGTWRWSAKSTAKYGCENPGAMTVAFRRNAAGGLTGVYTIPSIEGAFEQDFRFVGSMASVIEERSAAGRAITLDAPKSMRRILAVETSAGADGRPTQLEWSNIFGGFGEEPSPWDSFVPSAWLTRCDPL